MKRTFWKFIALGILVVTELSINVGLASIASANVDTRPPPAIKELQAGAPSTGVVVLSWSPAPPRPNGRYPILDAKEIDVYRGKDKIAALPEPPLSHIPNRPNPQPLTYTDANPPQPPPGKTIVLTYTVRVMSQAGVLSDPSPEASVTPVPMTSAAGSLPASDSGNGGNDIPDPGYRGTRAETAFELYGGASNGDFTSDYGGDLLSAFEAFPMKLWWKVISMLSFICCIFMGWSVSPKMFNGYIKGIIALVQVVFAIPGYSSLTNVALLLAGIALAIFALRSKFKRMGRAVVFMLAGIIVSYMFSLYPSQFVTTVVTYPTKFTSTFLGMGGKVVDQIAQKGIGQNRFGIKVTPDYSCPPKDHQCEDYQGVRKFQEAEFLNTVYAAKCKINFNDLKWATETFVTNRAGANGFQDLTPCEYLVRADHYGNSTEQQYLRDFVASSAPPDVVKMYNGDSLWAQYGITAWLSWALLFRTLLMGLAGYVFAMVVVALGLYMAKLTVMVFGWIVPWFEPFTTRLVKQMAIKFMLSPAIAVTVVLGMLLTSAALTAATDIGWTLSMFLQFVAGIVSLVGAIMLYRTARHKSAALTAERAKVDWMGTGTEAGSAFNRELLAPPPRDTADSSGYAQANKPHSWMGKAMDTTASYITTAATGGTSAAVDRLGRAARGVAHTAARASASKGNKVWQAGLNKSRQAWHHRVGLQPSEAPSEPEPSPTPVVVDKYQDLPGRKTRLRPPQNQSVGEVEVGGYTLDPKAPASV